jgi:hypothetical protein
VGLEELVRVDDPQSDPAHPPEASRCAGGGSRPTLCTGMVRLVFTGLRLGSTLAALAEIG